MISNTWALIITSVNQHIHTMFWPIKNFFRYLFWGCLLGLWACNPDNNDNPTGKLQVIWKKPHPTDELTGSMKPVVMPQFGGALFSRFTGYTQFEPLVFLDQNNGNELWTWQDYPGQTGSLNATDGHPPITWENYGFFSPGNGVFVIDFASGKTKWKENFNSEIWSSPIGSGVFVVKEHNDYTASLNLYDIPSGANREVYRHTENSTIFWSMTAPAYHVEPNGDTILYFTQSRFYYPSDGDAEVIAYNMSTQSVVFKNKTLAKSFNAFPPIIYKDQLIICGEKSMFSINRYTGELKWKRNFPGSMAVQLQQINDRLIYSDYETGYISAVSAEHGGSFWESKIGPTSSLPVYARGYLYAVSSGDGRLYALRLSDGAIVWNEPSPDLAENSGAFFSFGVSVDSASSRIYVATFANAYCFRAIE